MQESWKNFWRDVFMQIRISPSNESNEQQCESFKGKPRLYWNIIEIKDYGKKWRKKSIRKRIEMHQLAS